MITEETILEVLKTHNLQVDTEKIKLFKVIIIKLPNNYILKIKRDNGGDSFNAQINNQSSIEVRWFNINKELLERAINYVNTTSELTPEASAQKRDDYKSAKIAVGVLVGLVTLCSIAFVARVSMINCNTPPQLERSLKNINLIRSNRPDS